MSEKATIFIIEDDETVSKALSLLFTSIQLNVESFPDGPSYLKKHDPKKFGCLLVDVRMPKMSGLELQAELIKLNNPIPIIFISGHADVPMAVRAIRAGAVDFITKPFHNQALIALVQKALRDLEYKRKVPRN